MFSWRWLHGTTGEDFLLKKRFRLRLRPGLDSLRRFWTGHGRWDRVFSVLLVLAVLGAIGSLVYVIAISKVGERFTEFSILGPEGRMENYPREVILGESASVILGIANHENQPATYRIEITVDGQKGGTLGPIALGYEEEWEGEVSFTPLRSGPNQKVEFCLYNVGDEEVHLKTHLWVNVSEESGSP
ncbi:DUF1616 domain-containing protein [Chloroflexota bacterium]